MFWYYTPEEKCQDLALRFCTALWLERHSDHIKTFLGFSSDSMRPGNMSVRHFELMTQLLSLHIPSIELSWYLKFFASLLRIGNQCFGKLRGSSSVSIYLGKRNSPLRSILEVTFGILIFDWKSLQNTDFSISLNFYCNTRYCRYN